MATPPARPGISLGRLTVHPQTAAGLLVLLAAAALIMASSRRDPEFGVFATVGLGFGIVLQRSRFCFNAAFRDLFQFRSGRTMKGVIVGMAVATPGFGLHMFNLLPNPSLGPVAPEAHATPISLALVLGGLLFGTGMVIAGGCVSGSIYRMGEGYLTSWVSFGGILGGLLVAARTWNWWWEHFIREAPVLWLPRSLGYGGAVTLTLAGLGAVYLLVLWIESRGGGGLQEAVSPDAAVAFAPKVRGLARAVFRQGWPAAAGGTAAGLLNLLSYEAHMPWRVVGELSRWSIGGATLVGLAPGPLRGTEDLAACTLRAGGGVLTHGLLLNAGLFLGSLLAALLAHEFKLRIPRKRVRYIQALGGGLLMGYGGGIALGCTVGAFFSAIPSLALNGWVFALALAAGAYIGLRVIERIP
ncbi:MAG: YeeE/YedE family protein [candidate division NC10 bacterium]|nr:YeeE/YedE family protein [candidate division NC10 bacterium]